jgi:hypothetical protein
MDFRSNNQEEATGTSPVVECSVITSLSEAPQRAVFFHGSWEYH